MLNRSCPELFSSTIRHAYAAAIAPLLLVYYLLQTDCRLTQDPRTLICKRSAVTRASSGLIFGQNERFGPYTSTRYTASTNDWSTAFGPYLFHERGDIDVAGIIRHSLTTSDQSPLYSGRPKTPQLIHPSCLASLRQGVTQCQKHEVSQAKSQSNSRRTWIRYPSKQWSRPRGIRNKEVCLSDWNCAVEQRTFFQRLQCYHG